MKTQIPFAVLLETANLCEDRIYIGWSGYAPPRSKPGEPPAIDTGELSGVIGVEIISDDHMQVYAGLGEHGDYAEHLEYGTVNMAARPFMLPAAEKTWADFNRLVGSKYDSIVAASIEHF